MLCLLLLVAFPRRARAFDLSVGLGLGAMTAGNTPYFAVSPHVTIEWPIGGGFFFSVQETASFLPGSLKGWGFYNPFSVAVSFKWERRTISFGPSIALFYLPACGVLYCAHTFGTAPGLHARAEAYLIGPVGIAASGNVDWIIGDNSVLAGQIAGTVVVGPVIGWEQKVSR